MKTQGCVQTSSLANAHAVSNNTTEIPGQGNVAAIAQIQVEATLAIQRLTSKRAKTRTEIVNCFQKLTETLNCSLHSALSQLDAAVHAEVKRVETEAATLQVKIFQAAISSKLTGIATTPYDVAECCFDNVLAPVFNNAGAQILQSVFRANVWWSIVEKRRLCRAQVKTLEDMHACVKQSANDIRRQIYQSHRARKMVTTESTSLLPSIQAEHLTDIGINFPVSFSWWNSVGHIAVIPDGSMFAFSLTCEHAVFLLSTLTGDWAKFGSYGSDPGQFQRPDWVCFVLSASTILVGDVGNYRIQELTLEGTPLRCIPIPLFLRQNLDPFVMTSLSADANSTVIVLCAFKKPTVYVIDYSTGEVITSFLTTAAGDLSSPYILKLSPEGHHVVVADRNHDRLSIFTLNGEFVRVVCQCKIVTDLCFLPHGALVVSSKDSTTGQNHVTIHQGDSIHNSVQAQQYTVKRAFSKIFTVASNDFLYICYNGKIRVLW